jgi:dihydrofolate synthase/folylpolyglutamate synthase
MQTLTYRQIVQKIEALGVMPDRLPSLEPMTRALQRLLEPHDFKPEKTVVIAGTNGKGSVCATLQTLLQATGETVGLYTSPHLEETTERIQINGAPISEDLFCKAYSDVSSRLEGFTLTHFEVLTLMAAWIFFSKTGHFKKIDRAIFEVGLGGKWDATNAIPHHHCVITQLGYDHQNLLGNSLSEIAKNKFGIIHPESSVVYSPLPEEARSLLEDYKKIPHTRWHESAPFSYRVEQNETGREPQFFISTPWGETQIALAGRRGAENTMTALTCFRQLGFDPSPYLSTLAHVKWSGRMEKWTHPQARCPIYLSGDHNPQGVESLLELLPHYKYKQLYTLVGIGKDKDRDSILGPLFQVANQSVVLTQTPFRGIPIEGYGPWAQKAHDQVADPIEAIKTLFQQATEEDLILVTGSLYLVGEIKGFLRARTQQ